MLSRYLDERHACFQDVQAFIDKKLKEIPEYIYKPPEPVPSLSVYLANDFFHACAKTTHVLKKKVPNFFKFYQHVLEPVSQYRYVLDYVSSPLGLSVEYMLHKMELSCPESNQLLVANGGSAGAWSDLTCAHSKANVEVKTKWSFRPPNIWGGSYKWYVAQQRAGVKNYLIVVPRKGVYITLHKIKSVSYRIDDKFCAYYNSPYRNEASLRSNVELDEGMVIGKVSKMELDELEYESKTFMRALSHVYFGRKVRVIQNAWKKYIKNL